MGDMMAGVLLQPRPRGRQVEAVALIDTGSARTIISTRIARAMGAEVMPPMRDGGFVNGRPRASALIAVKLVAAGLADAPESLRSAGPCTWNDLAVVVDDELAGLAAPFEMLLGHDYLQRENAALLFNPRDMRAECFPAPAVRKVRSRAR